MAEQSSEDIRHLVEEHESARSQAQHEIDTAASTRRDLLLSTASDKEIAAHDANVARLRRVVDRCDARLHELRQALTVAEQRERQQALQELRDHAAGLADRYRDLAESKYLAAARALVAVLSEMDRVRLEFERATTALPQSYALPRIEEFRRIPGNGWRLPDFAEAVRLPAVLQADQPLWGEDSRRPTFSRPHIRIPEPARPEWDPPPAKVSRPNEQAELKKVHDRAHAEGRKTTLLPE